MNRSNQVSVGFEVHVDLEQVEMITHDYTCFDDDCLDKDFATGLFQPESFLPVSFPSVELNAGKCDPAHYTIAPGKWVKFNE